MRALWFVALACSAASAVAGDGYLDPSFGTHGRAAPLTPLANEQFGSGATAVLVQGDGKLLIAGAVGDASNLAYVRVIRLLADGSGLDPGFGSAGIAQVSVGSVSATNSIFAPVKMARAADGSLFVSAMTGLVNASVTKLSASGQLVQAFGNGGVSTAMQPPGSAAFALADLAVAPNGDLLLAGTYRANSPGSLGTVRVVALNSLTGAMLSASTIGSESGDAAAAALAQGTGFLIAGSGNGHCLLERVQYVGGTFSTDSGFGSGSGRVEISVASGSTRCRAVAVQRDGAILYAGAINKSNQSQNVLVGRLLANGNPDPSYNSGVPFQAYFESSQPYYENYATAVVAQDDGKVLIAGTGSPGPTSSGRGSDDMGVMRFTATGAYDATFQGDTDGSQTATTMVGFEPLTGNPGDDFGYAVALQSGRPLVVGYSSNPGFNSPVRYVVARLQNDPIYANGFQ